MSKPPLTYQDQLNQFKRRGLLVPDEPLALRVLEHCNYYRLSIYRCPFTVPGNLDQFQPGATFGQLLALYEFDRKLRQMVMEASKRVEISVRSRWAYEISHKFGPLSYVENQYFEKPLAHARTLTKLHDEMERSNEVFIKHHKDKLKMPWPPAWVIAEVATFGNTSMLVAGLKDIPLRQLIADTYQMDETIFCSVLHHISFLRNTASHHSRLWNRKCSITFKLPKKDPAYLLPNFHSPNTATTEKIYNSFVILIHLIRCIEPGSDWPKRLTLLINSLDPRLLPEMGFPPDWAVRPLWKDIT
jgi:abortive infection bacteriophage resistance protein